MKAIAEVNPAGAPMFETPAEDPRPPKPEEVFAAHVSAVQEHGDALDARKDLSLTRAAAVGIGAALAITPLVSLRESDQYLLPPSLFPCVPLAITAPVVTQIVRTRRAAKRAVKRLEQAADEIGNTYELYRDKEGLVLLHWLGTTQNIPVTDALVDIAMLSRKHGVDRIIVDNHMLNATQLDKGSTLPGAAHPVAKWMKTQKGIALPKNTEDVFRIATPDEWLDYARTITLREFESTATLPTLIAKLAAIDPKNPLVSVYRAWKVDKVAVTKRLRDASAFELESELSGSEVRSRSLKYVDELTDFSGSEIAKHGRSNRQARLEGTRVIFTNNGRYVESQDLTAALQLDREKISLIVDNFGANPAAAKRALTFLVYSACVNAQQVVTAHQEARPILGPLNRRGWQYLINHRSEDSRQRARTLWAALLGSAATSMAVIAGTYAIDVQYEKAQTVAAQAVAAEQGLDPQIASVAPEEVDQKLSEWSPLNTQWKRWMNFRDRLRIHRDPPAAGQESSQAQSGIGTSVGNIEILKDHAEWRITDVSGMDPVGGWWQATANELHAQTVKDRMGILLSWDTRPLPWQLDSMFVELPSQKPEGPFIAVERKLTPQDETVINSTVPSLFDGHHLVAVPVLRGTTLGAASFNGQPVEVVAKTDGSKLIVLPGPANGYLKYWVVPEQRKMVLPAPHMYGETVYKTDLAQSDEEIMAQYTQILTVWEKYIPGIRQQNSSARLKLMKDYIARMQYSLKPLPDDWRSRVNDPATFVDEVLRNRKANCNIAATTLWLSSARPMTSKMELKLGSTIYTAAVGYANNAGAGERILSTAEAHMVLTDYWGNIEDVTPSGPPLHAESQPQPVKSPLEPWMLIPGVLAMGALTFARRKAIMQSGVRLSGGARDLLRQRAARALQKNNAETLMLAADMAADYLYGDRYFFSPQGALERVKQAEKTQAAKEKAFKLLLQPHYNNAIVAKGVGAHRQVPKKIRRVYRQAARAVGRKT